MSTVKEKFVDVTCRRPIRLRNRLVRGVYHEYLTVEEIAQCISQYSLVEEVLPTGEKIVLDFTNYDKQLAPVQPKKEEPKQPKKEEPVVEETVQEEETTVPETTVVDEPVVEDADKKVAEAKAKTKGKK